MTRIPSSLIREQASGAIPKRKSKEPSAAEVAMMSPTQLKQHYQRRGEWEISREAREELFPFLTQPTGRRP